MNDDTIHIDLIFPGGAFGAWDGDSALDTLLRAIAERYGNEDEWPDKYGTDFENDMFMMHPFCWCERDDCPWCGGCNCPEEAYQYFIDGEQVSSDVYHRWFFAYAGPLPHEKYDFGTPEYIAYEAEWDRKIDERNRRQKEIHTPMCDYCKGEGVFAMHGAEPGRGAPNFWHKPSGFKVWWYKYIGRSVETNMDITPALLEQIENDCLR